MKTDGGRPFSGRGSSLLFPFLTVATLFFQNILHVKEEMSRSMIQQQGDKRCEEALI
jgi:hypothetical protein